jgi:DNA-binding response OmpR family regulator
MKNRRGKILVVDDDPDFREAITAILKSASYEVSTAGDAAEGKRKILDERPDLILLDIMMDSVFDGFSVCHAIRTSKEFEAVRNTPVIFVSAIRQVTGPRFGYIGGGQDTAAVEDYIDKPVKAADLLARIEHFLSK